MKHIVFCVIYCVFYLIHGLLFLFDIVSADMLSLITMMATCGLILNEMTKNHKMTKSVLSRFLPKINCVFGTAFILGMLVFTIMYFVNNGIIFEWVKFITILPIAVTVIFSIMSITKKGEPK